MEKLHIVNKSTLSKLIHKFNAIPVKIPTELFIEIYKLSLKFRWQSKAKNSQDHSKGKSSEEICPTMHQHFSNATVINK